MSNETITGPMGFRTAAVAAGIKASGKLDLGLIVADAPCVAAGVFTRNKVVGPSVVIDRERLRGGRAQAVFVNAGNANTCTGERGVKDIETISQLLGRQVGIAPEKVLVCSTGIIGHYLPMPKVKAGVKAAAGALSGSAKAAGQFARAILTTDTRTKTAWRVLRLDGREVRLAGVCKGSGMIAPNMATMLAFITTDAAISPAMLRKALREAADRTFNKVSVDNHTSTSDSVLVLASGRAGNGCIRRQDGSYERFVEALWGLCDDLARQIAADGEGATRMVTICVTGAATARDARAAVRAITDSPLVRCAFNGADPNWGRIISAVGYCGAHFEPDALQCRIAGHCVYRDGRPRPFKAAAVSKKMQQDDWAIEVDLGAGSCHDFCYTCDLSGQYVHINADYHT